MASKYVKAEKQPVFIRPQISMRHERSEMKRRRNGSFSIQSGGREGREEMEAISAYR